MREFIEKIFNKQTITNEELVKFIIDHCKLMGKKEPSTTEMQGIAILLKTGNFDIIEACKLACNKLKIEFIEVLNLKTQENQILFV